MSANWPVERLGDLVDASRGISYGIVQPGEHQQDGIPIVRVSDMRGDVVDTAKPLRVASSIEAAHARTRLRGGELIMSIVGTVGQTAIVDSSLEGWNVARAVAVIPVRKDIGPYWIRLALKGGPARAHIQDRLNTTVQATLNLRDLASLPIVLPPTSEREAIAATLGALDDKIELNRRMNATLESMARALFRDWFVDFGPTRAKMEGDQPYLPPELWSLFPDRLDSDGKPEGWEVRPILDVIPLKSGKTWPKNVRDEQGDAVAFGANGQIGGSTRWLGDSEVVFLGKIGSCGAINEYAGKYWPTNNTYYLGKHEAPHFHFSRQTLKAIDWKRFIGGSSNPYMPTKNFEHVTVLHGPADVMGAYESLVETLRKLTHSLDGETRTLTQTRDLLLPRLMSGELRISDLAHDETEPVA